LGKREGRKKKERGGGKVWCSVPVNRKKGGRGKRGLLGSGNIFVAIEGKNRVGGGR